MSLFSDRLWSSSGDYGLWIEEEGGGDGEEKDEHSAQERRDLKPLLARARVRTALVLTAGIFRRQAFRKIYGEVTAWIAMNSAHPPLSGLVIVLNLLAPQVLRAYT